MKFEVTCHAFERWSVRSSRPALDIHVAWLDAIVLEESDCEYDETPPEEWSEGLVGFKPAPVFDISQTGGGRRGNHFPTSR